MPILDHRADVAQAPGAPFHIRAYSVADGPAQPEHSATDTAADFAEAREKALRMARGRDMVAYVRDAQGRLAAWVERGQWVVRHGYKPAKPETETARLRVPQPMTALARLIALQRIREERVQELVCIVDVTPINLDCVGAVTSAIDGIRDADREVSLLARAIQPCDTADNSDAVLSVGLVAATFNLVSACDAVVAEGKLPPILHQLLKSHARQVRDLLENRKRRQLVAAAERVDAAADYRPQLLPDRSRA